MTDLQKAIIGLLGMVPFLVSAYLGGEWTSMSGARAWKEQNIEELMRLSELETEVASLQAQNRILLDLLNGATINIEITE